MQHFSDATTATLAASIITLASINVISSVLFPLPLLHYFLPYHPVNDIAPTFLVFAASVPTPTARKHSQLAVGNSIRVFGSASTFPANAAPAAFSIVDDGGRTASGQWQW